MYKAGCILTILFSLFLVLLLDGIHENSAAAHRMINFHLAKNDKKPRNRRNRNGRSNNKSGSTKEEQEPTQHGSAEKNHNGRGNQSKATSDVKITFGTTPANTAWGKGSHKSQKEEQEKTQHGGAEINHSGRGNQSKSTSDVKITFGAAPTAWGASNSKSQKTESIKTPAPWGPICTDPPANAPKVASDEEEWGSCSSNKPVTVSSSIIYNSKKGRSQTRSVLPGKRPSWGKNQQDSKNEANQTGCNTQGKQQSGEISYVIKEENKQNAWSSDAASASGSLIKDIQSAAGDITAGKQPNWGKGPRDHRVDMQNVWSSDAASESGDRKSGDASDSECSSVRSFGKSSRSSTENSSGVRRPTKASKAQALASKTVGPGISTNQQSPEEPQKTAQYDSTVTVLGKPQSKPSFGMHLQPHNNQAESQPQGKPSLGSRPHQQNNQLESQPKDKVPSFSTHPESRNNQPERQPQSKSSFGMHPQPRNKQPKNTRQSSGFHRNRNQNEGKFGRSNRGGGKGSWKQPSKSAQNVSTYTPAVVTNEIEDTENWDDETGNDECFGL